jgi:hypothetical protein
LALDIAVGAWKVQEFDARPGEGFRDGGIDLRLAAIVENVDSHTRSSGSGHGNMRHLTFRQGGQETTDYFVFFVQPSSSGYPLKIELLDASGETLDTTGMGRSGIPVTISLAKDEMREVARIRAHYGAEMHRVLVHLPRLPGMPAENYDADDLLEMRVPYVEFQDERRLETFLREALQMRGSSRTNSPSAQVGPTYPLRLRNATVADMLDLYAGKGDVDIDTEKQRITVSYPKPLDQVVRESLAKAQRLFR